MTKTNTQTRCRQCVEDLRSRPFYAVNLSIKAKYNAIAKARQGGYAAVSEEAIESERQLLEDGWLSSMDCSHTAKPPTFLDRSTHH